MREVRRTLTPQEERQGKDERGVKGVEGDGGESEGDSCRWKRPKVGDSRW